MPLYENVNGTLKELSLYENVNGTIKTLYDGTVKPNSILQTLVTNVYWNPGKINDYNQGQFQSYQTIALFTLENVNKFDTIVADYKFNNNAKTYTATASYPYLFMSDDGNNTVIRGDISLSYSTLTINFQAYKPQYISYDFYSNRICPPIQLTIKYYANSL